MRIARTISLFALLLLIGASKASAQQYIAPLPLGAEDPRAKVASELVQLLIQQDGAGAERFIDAHGVKTWATGDRVKTDISRVISRLKGKQLVIERFEQGAGNDIVVWLKGEKKSGDNVVVRMERGADPKVAGFGHVVIEQG